MNIETITSEISEPVLQQNCLKISCSQTYNDQNKVLSTLQFIQAKNRPDCLFFTLSVHHKMHPAMVFVFMCH